MTTHPPVFGTGLARSGGGLYGSLLSVHDDLEVAICPYLELFRSYRNAVVRRKFGADAQAFLPPSSPMQDYYFTDERLRVLDAIQAADLDIPFDPGEWESFLPTSSARGELEAADLAKHHDRLRGGTYREMFDHALDLVADVRQASPNARVGFHEAWILEFYPALARAYPDARFIVMFRDPRAIVNSMLGITAIDPLQIVQVLSYLRHWRKYLALALRYRNDPLFAGRIVITSHDSVLERPEATVQRLCAFLDVPYDPRMIDTENYVDFNTGGQWQGNSTFETQTSGISSHRAHRWKEKLDPIALRVVEFVCGTDMKHCGYEPVTDLAEPGTAVESDVVDYLARESAAYTNWRSDLEDPVADIGAELLRRSVLASPTPIDDQSLIRRCFLFEDAYDALRARASTPLLAQGMNGE